MPAAAVRSPDQEYIRFVRRILRAAARRLAVADPEDLVELIRLQADLAEAIALVVHGLRDSGATWDDIGRATGTSRQAAWEKWRNA